MSTRKPPSFIRLSLIVWLGICTACSTSMPGEVEQAYADLPDRIDYNFDVKPILSDRCYQCHGPDENTRKAGLRLDIQSSAFSTLANGNVAFVKGKPGKSEAFHRILSTDPEFVMPPPDSKLFLSPREKAVLVKWLEQGAEWKPHWAFIPVPETSVPDPAEEWTQYTPIDNFIQDKLRPDGLEPAVPAEKERLLRRVTMDLTGLPATLEEIDAFLADESPQAYEKVVDRLLDSDAHAERLALEWLDIARYADSHGVSFDGYRNVWPYRDWVIGAFRENMPFDEFITRQVAGDLRQDASDNEILASAFYRMNPMEASAGSIEEEYRLEYVAERTALTGTAFLGLTIGCARCHDHKFDPISQKEFYQLSAFFNSVEERGLGMTDRNRAPTLLMFDDGEKKRLDSLEVAISDLEAKYKPTDSHFRKVANYVRNTIGTGDEPAGLPEPYLSFSFESLSKVKRPRRESKSKPFLPETPEEKKKKEEMKKKMKGKKKIMEEVQLVDGNKDAEATLGVSTAEGIKGKALLFDEDYDYVSLFKKGNFDHPDPFSVSVWIKPGSNPKGELQNIIGNSGSFEVDYRGWEFYLNEENQLTVRMVHRLPDDFLETSTTSSPIPAENWTHVGFTYDGSGKASGVTLYVNGRRVESRGVTDRLKRSIHPINDYSGHRDTLALRIAKSYRMFTGDEGLYQGAIDELSVYDLELSSWQMARVAGEPDHDYLATLRKDHQARQSDAFKRQQQELKSLREERLAMYDNIDEVMVMGDLPEPRKTYILEQGVYNLHGEEVTPGTPARILPFDDSLPQNRLGLAGWLTDRRNPLTSRVLINRYWQMFFGKGIVKTAEDFGNQGDLPTHPELLDWLAGEFMENDWDLRHMIKLMVMSYTYRQSSDGGRELLETDPENMYYARMSSYRWPAEIIRDNALAASGLLVSKVGGPSVQPYQPDGLWKDLGDFSWRLAEYRADSGENLYRRSIYTFMRRFMPPPFMVNFDGPNREICIARRISTNTPLQALNLLNDPQFVEASRVLAERVQREAVEPRQQIAYGYRLATGISPAENQLDILQEQFEKSLLFYQNGNEAQADSLCMIGEMPRDAQFESTRTAALTLVMNTILNYDETYMKR